MRALLHVWALSPHLRQLAWKSYGLAVGRLSDEGIAQA